MALAAVILAAGLGTRMKSDIPKVLHMLNGKPVIRHVVDTAVAMNPDKITAALGPSGDAVQNALKGCGITFAAQKSPDGTAGALRAAMGRLGNFRGTVLVLSGDAPLVGVATLKKFLAAHKRRKEDLSILSFMAGSGHSYGRIIRKGDRVAGIVEDRDADPEQKKIAEVNSGIYAIEPSALKLVKNIKLNPRKKEYYLTDLAGIAASEGLRVGAHILGDETELTGINTRRELCMAGLYLRDRIVSGLLENGVSFIDAKTVFISPEARIGMDTIIYPNVIIEGGSEIGRGCVVYPNSRIINSLISDNVTIKDSSLIESSTIKDGASIGPFAHIRPGSIIGSFAKIGNFVEIKKSAIGDNSKASHLSYIGDSEVGSGVNIGAGTITCNYDGKNKHKTVIEDNSFIGSDTQLVAPVKVGKGAYVGSGSTVTADVPPGALALSRTPQINIEGWVQRKFAKNKKRDTGK
jgi:bifunctional UDP-N-acetylglucosamine pyrophosphorylase / glucosamine-1-phosphate N-acetyltransferase